MEEVIGWVSISLPIKPNHKPLAHHRFFTLISSLPAHACTRLPPSLLPLCFSATTGCRRHLKSHLWPPSCANNPLKWVAHAPFNLSRAINFARHRNTSATSPQRMHLWSAALRPGQPRRLGSGAVWTQDTC